MDGHTGHYIKSDRVWSMSSVLSKEQFTVIQLTYVEELTQVEVAREIGLSRQMVGVLLAQAYERMRKARNIVLDFDPSSGAL